MTALLCSPSWVSRRTLVRAAAEPLSPDSPRSPPACNEDPRTDRRESRSGPPAAWRAGEEAEKSAGAVNSPRPAVSANTATTPRLPAVPACISPTSAPTERHRNSKEESLKTRWTWLNVCVYRQREVTACVQRFIRVQCLWAALYQNLALGLEVTETLTVFDQWQSSISFTRDIQKHKIYIWTLTVFDVSDHQSFTHNLQTLSNTNIKCFLQTNQKKINSVWFQILNGSVVKRPWMVQGSVI